MPKYPKSQALFTRLLTEAGFRNNDGTYDRKRFCEVVGISPRSCKAYIDGDRNISTNKLIKLADKANLTTFNIL